MLTWFRPKVLIQNLHTLFIISIGTHYLLTIIALKFEIVHYITLMCVWDTAVCKTNKVDPDRTPSFATSDLGPTFVCKGLFLISWPLFNRCAPIIVSI